MPKLTERQFYDVGKQKPRTVRAMHITIVFLKNGQYALKGDPPGASGSLFKFIKSNQVNKLQAKYGKPEKYKKRK